MKHRKGPKKGLKPEINDGKRRQKMKPLAKEKYKRYFSDEE